MGVTPALDPVRRTFLARMLGGLAGAGAGTVGVAAVRQGLRQAEVIEVDVRSRRLPQACHGTTIVQLTDLHVGATIGRAFIEDIVRRTNALQPDIVAITGDLVDGSVEALWDAVAPLGELRAKHGVFFVTGNHEYFSGARRLDRGAGPARASGCWATSGWPSAQGADGFDLAGVHDYGAARLDPEHRSDVAAALAGRDPSREVVLLAHQPKNIAEAARLGVGLQLSGHTHGGQIWPFSLPRAAGPALRRGPAPPRRHPDLRQPRHRLLGSAHAPRHARRDHADPAAEQAVGLSGPEHAS